MNPKISIVVPNYNHQPYLQERLDSVFNQNYQDFEVILLDDASTDNSKDILNSYKNHPKVSHVIFNEINSGSPFKQWQKGIELVKGEYVWVAESDDYNDLSFLESCLSVIGDDAKIGLVTTALTELCQDKSVEFIPFDKGVYQGKSILGSAMLKGNSIRNGSSVLFRRSTLSDITINELPNFQMCGDWWLWVNILQGSHMAFIDKPLTTYRKHGHATTFKLRNNDVFYAEALNILRYIFSLKMVTQSRKDKVIRFWLQKIGTSNLGIEKKKSLINRFKKEFSMKRKIKNLGYKYKRKTRNVLQRFFHKAKRLYYTKLGLDNDLILVYTMSKVGSSSVYYSLKNKFPYKEIHHIHFLGDTWLNKFKTNHDIFKNNLTNAERIFKLLKKRRWKIKIITLTRDPVGRDISGIFQTWQHLFNESHILDVPLENIMEFLSKANFTYAENWFETDFKEFTSLDIFKEKFDVNTGYSVYKTEKALILVMQLEKLDAIFNEAMNTFIKKGDYILHEENITEQKETGALNKQVKQNFKMPKAKALKIYNTKYVTTFYNSSQIQTFIDKWI